VSAESIGVRNACGNLEHASHACYFTIWHPGVAELADAADSKSAEALLRVGSTPSSGTSKSSMFVRALAVGVSDVPKTCPLPSSADLLFQMLLTASNPRSVVSLRNFNVPVPAY
jgi:hypothetical protein